MPWHRHIPPGHLAIIPRKSPRRPPAEGSRGCGWLPALAPSLCQPAPYDLFKRKTPKTPDQERIPAVLPIIRSDLSWLDGLGHSRGKRSPLWSCDCARLPRRPACAGYLLIPLQSRFGLARLSTRSHHSSKARRKRTSNNNNDGTPRQGVCMARYPCHRRHNGDALTVHT